MAAAALSEIAEELQCPVCLDEFTRPKVLDCKHVFCCRCLVNWAKERNALICPVCKSESGQGREGHIEDLPEPLVLTHLQETVTRFMTSSQTATQSRSCDACASGRPAYCFCKDCMRYMCESCEGTHAKKIPYECHKVIRLSKRTVCTQHPGELKTLYCRQCELGICNVCFADSHDNHAVVNANEVVPEKEKELKTFKTSTEEIKRTIARYEPELKKEEASFEQSYKTALEKLTGIKNKFISLIGTEERNLHEKLTAERKKLVMHRLDVEDGKACQENLLAYVDEILDKGSALDAISAAEDVPSMGTNVSLALPRLERPRVREGDWEKALQSLVSYATRESEAMSEECRDFGARGLPFANTSCTKYWEKRTKHLCLDILFDKKSGDIWVCTDSETGSLVRYDARGHVVSRILDNKKVAAFCLDTKRDQFVVKETGSNHLTTVGRTGQVMTEFPVPEAVRLTRVAYVASRDQYAVTDAGSHQVLLVDAASMRLVRRFGSLGAEDTQLHMPYYVRYHSGAGFDRPVIIVGDHLNHCLKVFGCDGAFLSRYGSPGDGWLSEPTGLSVDGRGRVVVCDWEKRSVVRVWRAGGRERREELVTSRQLGGLYPMAVCLTDDGHMAVTTATWNNGVVVAPSHLLLFSYPE